MSPIKKALETIREVVKLVNKVKRTAGRISELATEVRHIDRRVSRLEGKWDAAVDFGKLSAARNTPPRAIGKKPKQDE